MFSVFHNSNSTTSTYLGWIRLEWTDMDNTETLTAIDWAYNDTPGASILTGQGIPAPTPEPSRALLALAGLGAMALRRRRKESLSG
jgi:MYXO-CTERM domain-containing protein